MMTPHLYGTSPYVPDAPFLDADDLSRQTGGNTGNLMFCHAISRILGAGPASIAWGGNTSHLSGGRDRLVLPLANQLGPHVDLGALAERMRPLDVPLVGVGLGAQGPISGIQVDAIPAGSWEWLRVLTSKSATERPNIALRGQTTFNAIAQMGMADKCVVTGCPSNFIHPSATLGREIFRRRANGLRRVVVAAGNPFLPQFRKLEHALVKMVDLHDGLYVCQHPIDLLRLHRGEYHRIARPIVQRYRDYIHPTLSDDEFLEWFRKRSHAFTSVPEWLSLLRGHDVVVGTRIHGVMAGIQAGIPGVCLCIDSRTLELCQTMMIPHADANDYRNGISLPQVEEILQRWDWRAYDDNRRILAERFVRFFSDNQLEVVGTPRSVLENQPARAVVPEDAPAYRQVHQSSTHSSEDRHHAVFGTLARTLETPNPDILVFGCADGHDAQDLARKHFHHARIVACDIDPVAVRIARQFNACPSRVEILDAATDDTSARGPFDLVVCMTVLCRWPETRNVDDASAIYPFERFSDTVEHLVSQLRMGGLLCVHNTSYAIEDTPAASRLEPVLLPELPLTQQVRLFQPDGQPAAADRPVNVLYRRIT